MALPALDTAETIVLRDGSALSHDGDSAELRDRDGRLLVRYRDGVLELASDGDVVIRAPHGEVRLEGQRVKVEAEHDLEVRAPNSRFISGVVTSLARDVSLTAERLQHRVDRYDLRAGRILERARDVFREASELVQQRAGQIHTFVDDTFSLRSRRSELKSEDDTSIDGKRVLLG